MLGVECKAKLYLAAVVSHNEAILPLLENYRVIDDVLSTLSHYSEKFQFWSVLKPEIALHFYKVLQFGLGLKMKITALELVLSHLKSGFMQTNLKLFLHLREYFHEADSCLRQQVIPRYILI